MGHPIYLLDANDSSITHLSESGWSAPRLSLALLEAPVGRHDQFKTKLDKSGSKISLKSDFDAELSSLLGHIQERLEGELDEAWISAQGYGMDSSATFDAAALAGVDFYNQAEEKWARAFTEMLVFAMYGGSGEAYGIKGGDEPIFSAFPRVFPISVACQHLSTLCVLSRGFPLSQMQSFVDAEKTKAWATGCGCTGGTLAYPVWEHAEKFKPASKYTTAKSFLTLKPTPGSVVVFNPGGPDYTKQDKSTPGRPTHIGSVLRVSGARVQFIDTGLLVGSYKETSNEGGTVDHSFLDSSDQINGNLSIIGVGILPAATGVDEWAQKMAAARSLGFVRLAVVDTSVGSHVRFVSKLLHMRYPVSRLIWSLRGLPIERLSVFWLVYIPRYSWSAGLLAAGSEGKPPEQLLTGKGGALHATHVLRGEPDGKVRVFRRKTTTTEDGFLDGINLGTLKPYFDEMGWKYPMRLPGDTKLGDFCTSQANVGKRFVDAPGDAPAVLDNGRTGVSFFDPD